MINVFIRLTLFYYINSTFFMRKQSTSQYNQDHNTEVQSSNCVTLWFSVLWDLLIYHHRTPQTAKQH